MGGMNSQFKRQKTAYKLDMNNLKFQNLNEMSYPRTMTGQVFTHANFVYAIGGNDKDVCERYDVYNDAWEEIASYNEVTSLKELNTWCFSLI
jgi:hypothetical protein